MTIEGPEARAGLSATEARAYAHLNAGRALNDTELCRAVIAALEELGERRERGMGYHLGHLGAMAAAARRADDAEAEGVQPLGLDERVERAGVALDYALDRLDTYDDHDFAALAAAYVALARLQADTVGIPTQGPSPTDLELGELRDAAAHVRAAALGMDPGYFEGEVWTTFRQALDRLNTVVEAWAVVR